MSIGCRCLLLCRFSDSATYSNTTCKIRVGAQFGQRLSDVWLRRLGGTHNPPQTSSVQRTAAILRRLYHQPRAHDLLFHIGPVIPGIPNLWHSSGRLSGSIRSCLLPWRDHYSSFRCEHALARNIFHLTPVTFPPNDPMRNWMYAYIYPRLFTQ